MPDILAQLDATLNPHGLFVRGAFHATDEDKLPALSDGRAVRTVALIGNAGMDLWRAFRAARPALEGKNPLEDWLDPLIERAAASAGAAQVIFPTRKPYPPIQRWAQRAENVHVSPIGILIHPIYGLFHVYRAALLFADKLDVRPPVRGASPCASCADKPCLEVCPADAFRPGGFDMEACVAHVTGAAGGNCSARGCLARRACPVGPEYRYAPEAGAFHMAAVVRAVHGMRKERGAGADLPHG
ncbi:MAG: hypothetical protein AB7G15_12110 [Alphaproteobacteria bacterium]